MNPWKMLHPPTCTWGRKEYILQAQRKNKNPQYEIEKSNVRN